MSLCLTVCFAAPQGIGQPDLNLMALIGSSRETDSQEVTTELSLVDDQSLEDLDVILVQNITKSVMEMTTTESPVAVQTSTIPSVEVIQREPVVKQITRIPITELNAVPQVVAPRQPYSHFSYVSHHQPTNYGYVYVPYYYPINHYPVSNSLSYSYSMQYH